MTLRKAKIVLLPGDGVGPEVVAEGVKILKLVAEKRGKTNKIEFEFVEELIGGSAIDATGSSLPTKTLESTKSASAILLGAVGGPQWPRSPGGPRPEQGLLEIRKSLDLYANLRPVSFASDSLIGLSSLKETVAKGTDFIFVRELVGGIYFGARREATAENPEAMDTCTYSEAEIQRVTRLAAHLALKHNPPLDIHSIDKANVLATSRLWRKVVTETLEKEFPKIKFDHCLVDSAAMHMIQNPKKLNGVILTENMFGDILSDEASVIVGSLGLLPSASLNGLPDGKGPCVGLYEPIHGSAPDIAGQGLANPIATILSVALLLRYSLGLEREAVAVEQAVRKTLDDYETPGMGLEYRTKDLGGSKTTSEVGDKIVEVLETLLEGLNSSDRTNAIPRTLLHSRPAGRRPMTMCEKIITHAAINLPAPGHVKPGDMVCVSVDWTLASELTWKGMDKTYDLMGRPEIYRNDRFWLAIDHTVDPRINHIGKAKELIKASEDFAKEAKLVDFYTPNFSILHTEFYRERAQPGQLIIGADSHTCSAGGLGCMAIGLGAGDVVMPLVTGETFLKVPETVEIKFVGQPPFGIGGKDTILYVLGELKRNTVAFERAVEYTGPGLKYLSPDARFAIANMSTEFGGIAGVCEADEQTAAFIAKRKNPMHRNNALYFRADPDAQYVESHVIDLSKVESLVALYPSPDKVTSTKEVEGKMKLDGVFIGACTTAEEDLILAALVLEAGLKKGMVPVKEGKRKVTPGSVPILAKLRRLGLLKVYEQAGYDIGAPGCSYCIAVAADKALPGEVWLSSQNRNFKNRMGPGSIANLASAATVAASSFGMVVMDPRELLDAIDRDRYKIMLDLWLDKTDPITISEPNPILFDPETAATTASDDSTSQNDSIGEVTGKVQRFEDNVDTDAIIPAQFMPGKDDADLGTHAFQYVRPEFVERVKQGFNIVVGGSGFGSGSSREEAPRALKGAGIKAVIAKSFAFIYQRNQPNMALLGVTVKDDEFYNLAQEGAEVCVNVKSRTVSVAGKSFPFGLSLMEERLIAMGGVTEMYKQFGKKLFRVATAPEKKSGKACGPDGEELAW